jgi:hypothetical protein
MALQSNIELRVLNGLRPVSSVSWHPFPVFNFADINNCLFTVPPSVFWSFSQPVSLDIITKYLTYGPKLHFQNSVIGTFHIMIPVATFRQQHVRHVARTADTITQLCETYAFIRSAHISHQTCHMTPWKCTMGPFPMAIVATASVPTLVQFEALPILSLYVWFDSPQSGIRQRRKAPRHLEPRRTQWGWEPSSADPRSCESKYKHSTLTKQRGRSRNHMSQSFYDQTSFKYFCKTKLWLLIRDWEATSCGWELTSCGMWRCDRVVVTGIQTDYSAFIFNGQAVVYKNTASHTKITSILCKISAKT